MAAVILLPSPSPSHTPTLHNPRPPIVLFPPSSGHPSPLNPRTPRRRPSTVVLPPANPSALVLTPPIATTLTLLAPLIATYLSGSYCEASTGSSLMSMPTSFCSSLRSSILTSFLQGKHLGRGFRAASLPGEITAAQPAPAAAVIPLS